MTIWRGPAHLHLFASVFITGTTEKQYRAQLDTKQIARQVIASRYVGMAFCMLLPVTTEIYSTEMAALRLARLR
mgnify:CR=1 FL=1